jgi:hypothetical protein
MVVALEEGVPIKAKERKVERNSNFDSNIAYIGHR